MSNTIGEKIRELRMKLNLTQEELARKMNISDKSISKWELGTSNPSLENLKFMAELFDVTVDELVNFKHEKKAKLIKKFVLTGGPCAGKTTAMNWIQNFFQKQGYKVLFVPEAATSLMSSGISPFETSSNFEFQNTLMSYQIFLEDMFEKSCEYLENDKIIIICDRGLLDNKAYMTNRDFKHLLKHKDLTVSKIMDRYDAVFHLVTAAKGAKEFYNLDNPMRTESIEEAQKLDGALISAWTGHPHLRVIDNSTNFEDKMKKLLIEISSVLGVPEPYEIERKFLILKPDCKFLDSLPNCEKVNIVQTYLRSDDNEEIRIRQRGINGSYTYSKTKKITINDVKRVEIETRLSQEEYINELQYADPTRAQIIKDRYCLLYKNQYFEVDIYPFWDEYAICEIELTDINANIEIPEFFEVVKEVTNDLSYKNSFISRMLKK